MNSWEAGLAFLALFMLAQWPFANFLLSPAADNWFFAGGGRHWPFFLKIDSAARTAFWRVPSDELTLANGIIAAAIAIISARLGIVTSSWLGKVVR